MKKDERSVKIREPLSEIREYCTGKCCTEKVIQNKLYSQRLYRKGLQK